MRAPIYFPSINIAKSVSVGTYTAGVKLQFVLYHSISVFYNYINYYIPLIWIFNLSIIAINSFTDLVALTLTLFLILLALFPKSQVDIVSSLLNGCGEHAISNVVLEFPPKLSYNNLVNLLYLNGICFAFPSANILIH